MLLYWLAIIQLISDYDRQAFLAYNQINENKLNLVDVDYRSSILKFRVSFKWQPLINDEVMEMFRQWAAEEHTHKSYLIFLSIIQSQVIIFYQMIWFLYDIHFQVLEA